MASTASDLFVERLMDWGVDTVFGLPGDGIAAVAYPLRPSTWPSVARR